MTSAIDTSPIVSRAGHLPQGNLFAGRYRIEGVLGEGAHSIVYAARDLDEQPVALKVIHRHLTGDVGVRLRFEREAATLATLEGEHVVRMLDFVEDDGLFAIALERVDGSTLESTLAERAPIPQAIATEIALQVCAALGAAHARGIVHRDLTPANVIIERRALGATTKIRVKVVDFGLCKVLLGDTTAELNGLTGEGTILGTAAYMAPEQASGDDVDPRADLYAAGAILYEMTVGEPPFTGRTPALTLTAHLKEAPRPPREAKPGARISAALEEVILKALAKRREDRFGSALELAEAIAATRTEPAGEAALPRIVGEDEDLGTVDTELHVLPQVIDEAKSMDAELEAFRRTETSSNGDKRPVRVIVSAEPPQSPQALLARAAVPKASSISMRETARVRRPPSALRSAEGEPLAKPLAGGVPVVWVVITLAAVLIAVAIGLTAGAR